MSNDFQQRDDQIVMAQLADDDPPPKRPGRWTILAIIVGMTLLVLGPVIFMGLPREASRWHQAAAEEAVLDGDQELAEEELELALQWWPDNLDALAKRAEWRQQDGQYEASLEDYDRVLEDDPNNEDLKLQRSVVYQHLGRHQDAVETWKEIVEKYQRAPRLQRATLLNGLAYAQAVGKIELPNALKNAQKAIELDIEARQQGGEESPRGSPEILDTRGYIHLLLGDLDAAEQDLNTAVREIEKKLRETLMIRSYYDKREYEAMLEQMRHSVAVVVYHRALLWEAKGETKKAEADKKRVRDLGFTPDDQLF